MFWLGLESQAKIVEVILFSIVHVVTPHLLDFFQVELASSAIPQQEGVVEPRVAVAHFAAGLSDPRLHLLQHGVLKLAQVSQVA